MARSMQVEYRSWVNGGCPRSHMPVAEDPITTAADPAYEAESADILYRVAAAPSYALAHIAPSQVPSSCAP
jgi:hypothetical protein